MPIYPLSLVQPIVTSKNHMKFDWPKSMNMKLVNLMDHSGMAFMTWFQ